MQVIHLSPKLTVFLLIILWPIFQVSISLLCLKIKDKYLSHDSFLYRTRSWEKDGAFYDHVFKIRKWKKFLPDGGAVMKSGYKKRHLDNTTKENLEKYVTESCRAELAHLLSILPFWIFGLFAPARVILYMLAYAVLVNLPCIIAQRYNRPRIVKLLVRMKRRAKPE